jgi:hypothetical protein
MEEGLPKRVKGPLLIARLPVCLSGQGDIDFFSANEETLHSSCKGNDAFALFNRKNRTGRVQDDILGGGTRYQFPHF